VAHRAGCATVRPVKRRDLLVSFLGLSVAQACHRPAHRAPIPGALIDKAVNVGHVLRGAPPKPAATTPSESLDCLVVGAGASGLAAAWRLRGAGIDSLRVVDLEETAGGTSMSGANAVSAYPWGAHYVPAPLADAGPVARVLREIGVLTGTDARGRPTYLEHVLVQEPEERLFYRGTWYEGLYLRAGATPDDLAQWARFDKLMRGFSAAHDGQGRKAFTVPLEAGSDDAEWTHLDAISMAQWLTQQGFTSPRLQWLVDYACRDDFGGASTDISAWAGIWYFASRRSGDEDNDGYLAWPEGNGRLVHHLSKSVGAERLSLHLLVHTLTPAEGGGWWADAIDARTRAPARLFARQVVLAVPRFVAKHVLAPWRTAPPAFLNDFAYSPWVVANLTLAAPPLSRGFPLAWDNVLYASKSLGYVTATHQRLRADATGPTVLTWYYPLAEADVVAQRERLLATSYADWEALVMADLMPAHPGIGQDARRLEVMRWGHAMIRPRPGFIWGPSRRAAQASLGGTLHFAHTDLAGLACFEEAAHHGVRAGEAVLAGLQKPSPSWL